MMRPSEQNSEVARYTRQIASLRRDLIECRQNAANLFRRLQAVEPELNRLRDILQTVAGVLGFSPEEIGGRFGPESLRLHVEAHGEDEDGEAPF